MKMLRITKGVTPFFHTHSHIQPNVFISLTAVSALKYEIPMFQELIKCLFDDPFVSYYVNALFFKMNRCFM